MKLYLLTMGKNRYLRLGSESWISTFSSLKEAQDSVIEILDHDDHRETKYFCTVNDQIYDWYEIINLNEWVY